MTFKPGDVWATSSAVLLVLSERVCVILVDINFEVGIDDDDWTLKAVETEIWIGNQDWSSEARRFLG